MQSDARFTVAQGGTEGKTIVSMNNKKKPFDDVRVRRAIAMAIDRKAVIDGAQEGYGKPIGSHMVPSDAGYVDLTAMNPYDPEKAKALLKEAGVATPLNVTLDPAAAAVRAQGRRDRRGAAGEGRHRREDRERRVGAVAVRTVQGQLRPDDHQPCRAARLHAPSMRTRTTTSATQSKAFRDLIATYNATADAKGRTKLLGDIQRQLADRLGNVYMFQLAQFAVSNKRLKGLWSSSPVAANDLAALSWQ